MKRDTLDRTHSELIEFVDNYVPLGWRGPIKDYCFSLYVSDEELESILSNRIPNRIKAPYIWAIQAWIDLN